MNNQDRGGPIHDGGQHVCGAINDRRDGGGQVKVQYLP